MKIKVLASGSKGNSTYIETEKIKLLIDIGVTFSYLSQELEKISVVPSDLDGLLIRGTHSDNIT
ncbi:MAG: MBL fold metallo-hydrolase, partial [Bacilli bacterium]|nr:MBL fold metallo-hydrolase [Bacilli bacterium]